MQKHLMASVLLLVSSVTTSKDIGNQFLTVKLQYGATISIPKSWQVLRGYEMRATETAVGAAIDLSGYAKLVDGTETLLVSSFPDPKLYAGVTVTSTLIPSVISNLPAVLSDAQVKSGEQTIRQGTEATQDRLGVKVWGWTPLRKVSLGNNTVMHTSYLRSSLAGDRRVQLYKFFGSGRIYDVAVSSNIAHDSVNNIVLEKIVSSFTVP